MKKILIFIVGILGIGLSFCSAGEYTINFLDGTYIVYDNLGNTNHTVSFSWGGSDTMSYCPGFRNISCSTTLSVSGISSDIFLTNICLPKSTNSNYRIFPLDTSITYSINGNYYCYDLSSNPINLKDSSYSLFPISLQENRTPTWYAMGFLSSSVGFSTNSSTRTVSISFPSLISDLPDFVLNLNGQYYTNGGQIAIPSSMTFYIPTDPKFKVNYGNTSYEYTLEDNLEIHLNSPVVKNGDVYSYAGSTGINLFYNGGSLFYNKPELYLFTPSWYSNNIFTPICL